MHGKEDSNTSIFLVHSTSEKSVVSVWIIDSGFSNHMMGMKELFEIFNKSQTLSIRLCNDKEITVMGLGTVTIRAKDGCVKLLHDIQFVSGLAHNLLSVGQHAL